MNEENFIEFLRFDYDDDIFKAKRKLRAPTRNSSDFISELKNVHTMRLTAHQYSYDKRFRFHSICIETLSIEFF